MRAIAGTLQRSRTQRDEKAIVTATPALAEHTQKRETGDGMTEDAATAQHLGAIRRRDPARSVRHDRKRLASGDRRSAGHWRLVHRHADYAQPDPRNKP